jgi:hypothetical protein
MTTTYSEQLARIMRQRLTRGELIENCLTLAAEADKWMALAGEWRAVANSSSELIERMHASSEEHVERLAKMLAGASLPDDNHDDEPALDERIAAATDENGVIDLAKFKDRTKH